MLLTERFDEQRAVTVFATPLMRGTRQRVRHGGVASRAGDDAQISR
jgi:hypothetical protein